MKSAAGEAAAVHTLFTVTHQPGQSRGASCSTISGAVLHEILTNSILAVTKFAWAMLETRTTSAGGRVTSAAQRRTTERL